MNGTPGFSVEEIRGMTGVGLAGVPSWRVLSMPLMRSLTSVRLGAVKGARVRAPRGATLCALDRGQSHATLGAERHGPHHRVMGLIKEGVPR